MSGYLRLSFEEEMEEWGISAEQRGQIPDDAKAKNYAILIVPKGTHLEQFYGGYTYSQRCSSATESIVDVSEQTLGFMTWHEHPDKVYNFRLNCKYGADMASLRSLAAKGCDIFFDLPDQGGNKISGIQNGDVYLPGVTAVIRVYLDGTKSLPSAGSARSIDLKLSSSCTRNQMQRVLDWLNKRLV